MNVEWLARLRLRCASLLHRRQLNRELEEELTFHLLTRADVHREAGLSAAEAQFLSRRQFGNPTSFQEVLRNMWTFSWLEGMLQDIRHAGRTLRILERRTQAQDHPILLTVPETHYLKCVIAQVC